MTDLTPVSSFDNVIEHPTNQLVLGGPGGPMNLQAQSLLNRTEFLNDAAVSQQAEIAALQQFDTDIGTLNDVTKGLWKSGFLGESAGAHLVRTGLTPYNFGAVGDGIADDTTPLLNWGASPMSRSKHLAAGRFKVSSQILMNPGDRVFGDGPDTSILDFAAGAFAGTECLKVEGTLTLMPDLSADVPYRSNNFSFVAPHGLASGDVCVIHNPTNSSFSTWRTDYQAGEFIRAGVISSTTAITSFGLTYDSYLAANMDVYKLTGKSTSFRDIGIVQPATANAGLSCRYIDGPVIENVKTGGSVYAGISLERCVKLKVHAPAFQAGPASGDDYGLVISNCQGGTITGQYDGTRHGIAFGGAPGPGNVPTRDFDVMATYRGLAFAPMDLHGNTEDIRFIGCTTQGGGIIAGKNHTWTGCNFLGSAANSHIAMFMGEVVGGTFNLNGCTFEATTVPLSGNGIISMQNYTANAGLSRILFSDSIIKCPDGVVFPVLAAINGSTANHDIVFDGVTVIGADATRDRLIRLRKFSGTGNFGLVAVSDMRGFLKTPGSSFVTLDGGVTAATLKLPSQRGTITAAVTTAISTISAAATFPYAYPRTPPAGAVTNQAPTQAGSRVTAGRTALTSTTITGDLATCSGTNFGSATNVSMDWVVTFDEQN